MWVQGRPSRLAYAGALPRHPTSPTAAILGERGARERVPPLSFPATLLDLDLRKPATDFRQEYTSPRIAAE